MSVPPVSGGRITRRSQPAPVRVTPDTVAVRVPQLEGGVSDSFGIAVSLCAAEEHLEHPLAVDVGVAGAARVEQVRVGAARLLKCIREDGKRIRLPAIANGACEVACGIVVDGEP